MKFWHRLIAFLLPLLDKWLLPAIILFASILRVFMLEYSGLWTDEIGQVQIAENTLVQTFLQSVRHNASAPLDYVFTHLALYVGKSEGVLRMPAVIFGVLAVFAIYKIGHRMFDKKTGIIASFLLAILPLHVYYSREVRFYSLATLFALLSLYFFIKAIESNTRRDWIIFGVIQILGLYSHYYLLAISAIEGSWLLFEVVFRKLDRKIFVNFLVAAGIAVLTFLPWAFYDLWFEKLNGRSVFNVSRGLDFHMPTPDIFLTGNLFYYSRYFDHSRWWIVFCIISLVLGLVLGFGYRKTIHKFFSPVLLLSMLYFGGIVFVLVMDALATYFFANRQLLIFVPYLLLIVAASVVRVVDLIFNKFIRLGESKTNNILVSGILVSVCFFSVWSLGPGLLSVYSTDISDWKIHRLDFRRTGQYLTANVKPDDILMTTHNAEISFYAEPIQSRITRLPDDPKNIQEEAQTHDRVWLLTSGDTIGVYPNISQFIQTEKPLELSLHPGLLLYVYSTKKSNSEILLELLESNSIAPSTMILTNIIERAIKVNYQDEMYQVITSALQQKDLENVNKVSIATIGGDAYMRNGDLEKASSLIQQALALKPSDAKNWTMLGNIYSESGNLEDAISAYKKSLAIRSEDYWTNYLLAYRLRQLDRWQEALPYAEKALSTAPKDKNYINTLNEIALINEKLGNMEQACGAYAESYQIKKDQAVFSEMEKLSCPGVH